MDAFYLLIKIGMAIVVIPNTYQTLDDCHTAGKNNDSTLAGNYHYCIPAPHLPPISLSVPGQTGYYCGQYPDKCKIKE